MYFLIFVEFEDNGTSGMIFYGTLEKIIMSLDVNRIR